jgi:hypothetical protein
MALIVREILWAMFKQAEMESLSMSTIVVEAHVITHVKMLVKELLTLCFYMIKTENP